MEKRFTYCIATLAVIGFIPGAASALDITIDFEDLGFQQEIAGHYAADGVNFSNFASAIDGIDLNDAQFPPTSGAIVARVIDSSVSSIMSFVQPTVEVAFNITTSDDANIIFNYEGGGQSIVAVSNLGSSFAAMYADDAGISSIEIGFVAVSPSDAGWVIDDLVFTSPAVPEPRAALLMLTGLLVVHSGIRHRWNSK
jgi:hypothetical protein